MLVVGAECISHHLRVTCRLQNSPSSLSLHIPVPLCLGCPASSVGLVNSQSFFGLDPGFAFCLFFPFFFLTRTFHNSGESLKNYLQVEYFTDKFFFSPSKFSSSSLKNKNKPVSILAVAFGWRFLPMPTIAPLPSHTLRGLYFMLSSRDYKNAAF